MLRYKEIFLGSQCNNKCLYCPVCHKDLPQPDLHSLLDSLKKREDDNVVLYGGEPTLNKDLFAIIDAAKKNGYRRIKLITNGRALSDAQFLYRLIAAGCRLFEIKLWGSHPPLHDHLTRTAGSFPGNGQGPGKFSRFSRRQIRLYSHPRLQGKLYGSREYRCNSPQFRGESDYPFY